MPLALFLLTPALFAQETRALPGNSGFTTIKEILTRSCSACHDWTTTRADILEKGGVVPGKPGESKLYQQIAGDVMPLSGDKLTADEKAFIRGWIQAGAPETSLPISVASGAPPAAPAPRAGFKVPFHEVTGFTSVALFSAAGVLGVIHYFDMKNVIHPGGLFSDSEGTGGEGDFAAMTTIWNNQQALRWWHVGLVISGEALYLGDMATGLSMLSRHVPGKVTRSDIHRWAFVTHASLMAAQIVLGFLETDALSRGLHDESMFYTGAHTLIGVAIPAIMLYAGLENVIR